MATVVRYVLQLSAHTVLEYCTVVQLYVHSDLFVHELSWGLSQPGPPVLLRFYNHLNSTCNWCNTLHGHSKTSYMLRAVCGSATCDKITCNMCDGNARLTLHATHTSCNM